MLNLLFLVASLFLVFKSSDFAIRYASNLAYTLKLPKYVIGFIVVAVISILPETFISINAAVRGIPSFGLGTLFGSNVADLTLVLAVVVFSVARGLKVESKILEENRWYPFFLALPILVGFDGYYSRVEGLFLIAAGIFFFYLTFRKNHHDVPVEEHKEHYAYKNLFFLACSMGGLLLGSHLTVKFGVAFAEALAINPVLIGMFFVGLGTTLPELFFSLKAVRHEGDGLALGDVLGTVISDATIAVGVLALINPFSFPQKIVYITATFMVAAAILLFSFMRSGRIITKKEGLLLLLFYAMFVLVEYTING